MQGVNETLSLGSVPRLRTQQGRDPTLMGPVVRDRTNLVQQTRQVIHAPAFGQLASFQTVDKNFGAAHGFVSWRHTCKLPLMRGMKANAAYHFVPFSYLVVSRSSFSAFHEAEEHREQTRRGLCRSACLYHRETSRLR